MTALSREMNCRELERKLTAYLEGALARGDRQRFEAHLGNCPACRLEMAQWEALVGSLRRREDLPQGATSREKERLLALFHRHGFHCTGERHPDVPLGVGGELAAAGDHIACLSESEQDFMATVGFVATGATEGETCVLLGHEEANTRLEAAILRTGLDIADLKRQERLCFVSGTRSADALLEEIRERVRSAVDRGAPLVRILGNLGWSRPDWPGDRDLLRLEARLTDAVRRLPVVVMCVYDVHGVARPNLLLGGLECHPLTLHRNGLRSNGLYVPAETFLATLPRAD